MASQLGAALGQVLRGAWAPAAWHLAVAAIALAVALVTALAALGFAVVGCYLVLTDELRLSEAAAAFITAGALLVIAAIAVLILRRYLFGRRARPQHGVSEEARRAVATLEAEAAEAIANRPAASLLACGIAGLLIGALRRPPRR